MAPIWDKFCALDDSMQKLVYQSQTLCMHKCWLCWKWVLALISTKWSACGLIFKVFLVFDHHGSTDVCLFVSVTGETTSGAYLFCTLSLHSLRSFLVPKFCCYFYFCTLLLLVWVPPRKDKQGKASCSGTFQRGEAVVCFSQIFHSHFNSHECRVHV